MEVLLRKGQVEILPYRLGKVNSSSHGLGRRLQEGCKTVTQALATGGLQGHCDSLAARLFAMLFFRYFEFKIVYHM